MANLGRSGNKKTEPAQKKAPKKKNDKAAAVKKTNRPGRGGNVLPPSPKPFSKTNQPSNEAKKAGHTRRRLLKDILNITTGAKFEGSAKDYRFLTAKYLGIPENQVSIRMVMDFRQIEKAILKGDTQAYNALMDRGYGKPIHFVAQTDTKGNDVPLNSLKITFE